MDVSETNVYCELEPMSAETKQKFRRMCNDFMAM